MRRHLFSLAASFVPLFLFGVLACGAPSPSGGDGSAAEGSDSGAARSYTVRGQVRQVPRPDRLSSQFLVRHEAVPGFVGADGQVVGMESMSMPFPVRDEALLEGIEAGDLVEMTFRVDWDADTMLEVVSLVELPPETALDFGE